MENVNNILIKACVESLAKKIEEKIKEKGGSEKVEPTLEAVIGKLGYLATESVDYGEIKRYIPLSLKEILLFILYPQSRINCKLHHSQDMQFWEAEAYVYLEKDDVNPKGEGRFAYTLTEYANQSNSSEEVAKIGIGNWVRGMAKTRAIQSTLPFLNLFCEEDVIHEEEGAAPTEFPDPGKKDQQEKLPVCKKSSEGMEENPPQTESKKAIREASEPKTKEPKETKETKETSPMTLEMALAQIADVGNAKGYTLKEIYEKQPRNLVWMLGKGGSKLQEALRLIIEQDEDLKVYL